MAQLSPEIDICLPLKMSSVWAWFIFKKTCLPDTLASLMLSVVQQLCCVAVACIAGPMHLRRMR